MTYTNSGQDIDGTSCESLLIMIQLANFAKRNRHHDNDSTLSFSRKTAFPYDFYQSEIRPFLYPPSCANA